MYPDSLQDTNAAVRACVARVHALCDELLTDLAPERAAADVKVH